MRRIGVLMGYAETDSDAQAKLAAFRESLYKLGWVEGGNIRMDARWPIPADTKSMQRFAKELVELEPDLILFNSNGGSPGIDSWYFVSRRLRYDPLDMIEHEEVRHDNEAAFGLPCQRCQNSFDFGVAPRALRSALASTIGRQDRSLESNRSRLPVRCLD